MKCFSCFSQSQSIFGIGGQTADTDCDWLQQLKHFAVVLTIWFVWNRTVLFRFSFSCADIVSGSSCVIFKSDICPNVWWTLLFAARRHWRVWNEQRWLWPECGMSQHGRQSWLPVPWWLYRKRIRMLRYAVYLYYKATLYHWTSIKSNFCSDIYMTFVYLLGATLKQRSVNSTQ